MRSIPRRKTFFSDATRSVTHNAVYLPFSFQVRVAFGASPVGGHWSAPPGECRFEQDLESVADAEDELVLLEEVGDGLAEVSPQLAAEHDPGSHVVAVAEPARDAEDLVVGEALGVFEHAEQVHPFRLTSAQFECVSRFDVAVRAGSTQYTDAGGRHSSSFQPGWGDANPDSSDHLPRLRREWDGEGE